jgi:N-acetylglucosaminyldiphosphoundecaprenol N-acetyl-beta-D-mannosaminyltransferase
MMARLLGIPIRERIAGSSLFDVLRGGATHPLTVYFFGGPPGVAARACEKLNADGLAMKCVGYECPGFGSVDDMSSPETIQRINASGADFLVVALGAKKGQEWIMRNRARFAVPVVSHLGAVVNFVAGTLKRAPIWVQSLGMEWLWRIKEDPALWSRYWHDGRALIRLLCNRVLPEIFYRRTHRPKPAEFAQASANLSMFDEVTLICLNGAWSRDNLSTLQECFAKVADSGKDIEVDMADVSHVDSAFFGLLMLLHGHQHSTGRQIVIIGVSQHLRHLFKLSCVDYMLAG